MNEDKTLKAFREERSAIMPNRKARRRSQAERTKAARKAAIRRAQKDGIKTAPLAIISESVLEYVEQTLEVDI
jgi:hypothetical protein